MVESISIIMPSLNSARFIRNSIESVLAQTHKDLELIVIDNPSVDGTSEIVAHYAAQDGRVRHVRPDRNLGSAARTRNYGLALAQGNHVAFIDSDDLWHPEKLAQQLLELKRTGSPFAYTGYAVLDAVDNMILSHEHVPARLTYRGLLKKTVVATSTVLFDRRVIQGFQFPEDVPISEDYAAWLEIFKRFDFACGVDKPLAYYRVVPHSLSSQKYRTAGIVWSFYRRREHLDPLNAAWCFLNYALYAWFKNRRFGRV